MDSPTLNPEEAQNLSNGRRRSTSNPNSPEFEFWMVRNRSFPPPNLLSADQLFVDGVILPLHLLPLQNPSDPPDPSPKSDPITPDPEPGTIPGPEISPVSTVSTTSKRWTDIFKKGEKKNASNNQDEKEKDKKKERKSPNGSGSAELNINIWPFSRSRSAGNATTRPKIFPGTRKVNSAPCSRSNSQGESKSRKWPTSPGRAGVHLGRSSPVWQVRRGGSGAKNSEPMARKPKKGSIKETLENRQRKSPAGKTRVLNLNVPMCIGYRPNLSCRSDENSSIAVGNGGSSGSNKRGNMIEAATDSGGDSNGNVGNSSSTSNNLFNLRGLFTKKVY